MDFYNKAEFMIGKPAHNYYIQIAVKKLIGSKTS